jgi:hypothetical protein
VAATTVRALIDPGLAALAVTALASTTRDPNVVASDSEAAPIDRHPGRAGRRPHPRSALVRATTGPPDESSAPARTVRVASVTVSDPGTPAPAQAGSTSGRARQVSRRARRTAGSAQPSDLSSVLGRVVRISIGRSNRYATDPSVLNAADHRVRAR